MLPDLDAKTLAYALHSRVRHAQFDVGEGVVVVTDFVEIMQPMLEDMFCLREVARPAKRKSITQAAVGPERRTSAPRPPPRARGDDTAAPSMATPSKKAYVSYI